MKIASPLERKARFCFVLLCIAGWSCGGAKPSANSASTSNETESDEGEPSSSPIPVRPRDSAPPALTSAEKNALTSRCAPIEPEMYDAQKQATMTLDGSLAGGEADAAAEEKALAAGLAKLSEVRGGLSAEAHERCVALFTKKTRRALFDHEPTTAAARATIDACMRRAVAVFGKEKMSFQMGSNAAAALSAGPFCPEDDPVPVSLAELPYKSSKDDWDNPSWRCLQFGLRSEQNFQLEYRAIPDSKEFACIARFMPRHGGPPIEMLRGGKLNADDELVVGRKLVTRPMKR